VSVGPKKERFVQRHLDPASRIGEILFGLIMVLSVTLTAGLTVSEGRAGVRQLLVAALGCNIAWGIIWAAYVYTNRLVAGLAMVAIGFLLVGVAVLLGG
jgi:hypothetical protein